ncbi:MAG: hemerythrin family protein [Treponema sp.]|jgi:hemerythrin|nr:hemerythrin family protein [Treponema sp.]
MEYKFDKSLETGHAKIDEQHKQLFVTLNTIIEESEQGRGKDEIYKTMDFLNQYTIMHFKTEETLQKEYGFPGYEAHKKCHEDFKTTVKELTQALIDKGPVKELIDAAVKTVGDWLVTHIKGNDIAMAAYLKSKGDKGV